MAKKELPKITVAKKGLGRGLSSLMQPQEAAYDNIASDNYSKPKGKSEKELPIEFLVTNSFQPRIVFDDAKAKELTDSVREKGILQPILVRTKGKDQYEIIAGERRWRAAQAAGLHEVPVIIKEMSDGEALEVAIIENIQRHDLNPIEEARGYQRLIDEFSHTQNALAKVVGKSRSHVANFLRLISLPEAVQKLMSGGLISMGHARALITAENPEQLAKLVIKDGLSVRQTEKMAKTLKSGDLPKSKDKSAAISAKDPDTIALENELSGVLGLKISLESLGGEAGVLKIHFKTYEQLDDVCLKLNNGS